MVECILSLQLKMVTSSSQAFLTSQYYLNNQINIIDFEYILYSLWFLLHFIVDYVHSAMGTLIKYQQKSKTRMQWTVKKCPHKKIVTQGNLIPAAIV